MEKKMLGKGILAAAVLAVFSLLWAGITLAAELQVGSGKAYINIGSAMSAATEGDVIKIWPGDYAETIQFKTGITVEGLDVSGVRITGSVVLASNVMLKDVTIEGDRLCRTVVSANGVKNVKMVGLRISGGEYGFLTERLISVSNSQGILIYGCDLRGTSANCAVFENGCKNLTVMRTSLSSGAAYRREALTALVIRNAQLIKIYNNSFSKGRSWHPVWRGHPILLGDKITRMFIINNIFYADVNNDSWQYGRNGLWIDGANSVKINYNIFYQTGLFSVIPLRDQHHLNGRLITLHKAIEANPGGDGKTVSPTIDSGSPAFPYDPDFTRADIGKDVFMQYDKLI